MAAAAQVTWQEAVVAGGREAGLDAITDLALDALVQELPALREDPDLRESARSSTAANIALAVELVRGALTLDQLEPPPQATAFTRELARRNIPVAELDRAYRISQRALWRWAAAQVRARVHDNVADAIEGLSEAVFATGDVLSATVMQQYAAERERWMRSADALRAATLQEVLAGGPVDIGAAGSRLRYELRQTHQAFVVWADGDAAAPEAAATAVGGARALIVPVGGGVYAGWAPDGTLDPEAADADVHVALGSGGAEGEDGFRRSHAEALEARRVARLHPGGGRVVRYDDVALLALLTKDPAQAQHFVQRTLGPLAAADPATARLAQTLHVALEEQGSPRRAAHRLGIHENTVAKRLHAVDELLGGWHGRPAADLLAALTILRAARDA